MYPGYIRIGGTTITSVSGIEIVNTARACAYAAASGLDWLKADELDVCEHQPGFTAWTNPVTDNAPWYDAGTPDTAGFLGVIGLSAVGDQNSTRKVRVTNTITVGGVIGRAYY